MWPGLNDNTNAEVPAPSGQTGAGTSVNPLTMKDAISIQRAAGLHPKVKDDFINFIIDCETALNITLRITQGLRTFQQQQDLYNQGRITPGKIVTNAKAGQSYHQYGLAVDLVELINNGSDVDWGYNMGQLVPYAKKYNINWGGTFLAFKDLPHFEKTLGYNWRDLLARHQAGDFIAGTQFVNL